MQTVTIVCPGQEIPLPLAARELAHYLAKIAAVETVIATTNEQADPATTIWLGCFTDFPDRTQPWPTVDDPALDDAIVLDLTGPAGIIAGSNLRSVLLGVYRYLQALGCRWVRPGAAGELLPAVDLNATTVQLSEAASYRHRGICIEGAISYEHVRDLVRWMPKVGLNSYFIQFREAFTFFERWYTHTGNPLLYAEPFTVPQARALKQQLGQEIAALGLVYHDVGHGWTCDPLGIPGLGWTYAPPPVPPDARQYLAEVNGKRELWERVPLNTQLCYSNPTVHNLIVNDIVTYAGDHPEVDVIHFWLGDGFNNHCECADCQQARPADWYLRLLNTLDARLTAADLPTRIVFLIYFDLLWTPEVEHLQVLDRFILMFAPITRTYTNAFAPDAPIPTTIPPYQRNRLTFPANVAENLAFLQAWQREFNGDSFDYDYHLMWDLFKDPGAIANATVLHDDIVGLADLGLRGLISCQVQRCFFPTGIAMAVLGETLWDRTKSFQAIATDHFVAAFGADGPACLDYCTTLSAQFQPPYLRGELPEHDPDVAATFATIPDTIAAFQPVIERNLTTDNPCQAQSWRYLALHAEICLRLAEALHQRALGDDDAAAACWRDTVAFTQEHEHELHPVFDCFEFFHTIGRYFNVPAVVTIGGVDEQ